MSVYKFISYGGLQIVCSIMCPVIYYSTSIFSYLFIEALYILMKLNHCQSYLFRYFSICHAFSFVYEIHTFKKILCSQFNLTLCFGIFTISNIF